MYNPLKCPNRASDSELRQYREDLAHILKDEAAIRVFVAILKSLGYGGYIKPEQAARYNVGVALFNDIITADPKAARQIFLMLKDCWL